MTTNTNGEDVGVVKGQSRVRPRRSQTCIGEWITDDDARETTLQEVSAKLDGWLREFVRNFDTTGLSAKAVVQDAFVRILTSRADVLTRRMTRGALRSELLVFAYKVCADVRTELLGGSPFPEPRTGGRTADIEGNVPCSR